MKLSVVLATFNEEKNIGECLQSVLGWADELIVVDGSSTDKTEAITRHLGARVYSVPNNPMFHKNKQLAVEKAKGEWILQLDADERVSDELKKEIQTVITQTHANDGYYIPRKNWFLGRFLTKGGVYPDYVIRLFKNGKGHFPAKSVHEQIAINGSVGHMQSDLIHFADPNLEKYLVRFNRYSSLEAESLVSNGFTLSLASGINYIVLKPFYWFLMRFIRHRGYVDGFQGFLFALLSALHYPVIFLKAAEIVTTGKHK